MHSLPRRSPPASGERRRAIAALSTLYRFNDVESATTTSFGAAPIRRAILAAMRSDKVIHPDSLPRRSRWTLERRRRSLPRRSRWTLERRRRVPTPDQTGAPLVFDHRLNSRRGRLWQHAKRVAIEVDHALGVDPLEGKLLPQRGKLIDRVPRDALLSCRHSDRRMARTGDASAPMSLSGSAMSS